MKMGPGRAIQNAMIETSGTYPRSPIGQNSVPVGRQRWRDLKLPRSERDGYWPL